MATQQRLDEEAKAFLVERLACYDTPTQAQAALKEEFGLDVSLPAIQAYDPTKRQGKDLSQKLVTLFRKTREKFQSDVESIPISHKALRLKTLDRARSHFERVNNFVAAADMCERAAKEMGGAFTNQQKHEHSGKDGTPLTASVFLTGAPAAPPAPKAVGRVSKRGD